MSISNQVKRILQFEFARNKATPFILFAFSGMLFIVFASEPSFDDTIIMDIIFVVLFSGSFTTFGMIEVLKPQTLGQNMSVSHAVIFLQQLPVDNRAIIHSRIIIHNAYNFFIQFCFIIPLYLFIPAFQKTMSIQTFIIFLMLWMSIGVFFSGFSAADDAGKPLHTRDRAALIRLIMLLLLIIGSWFVLYTYTPYTLIGGSIQLIQKWPLIICLVAISIASSGIIFGRNKMKRILQTTDYM